MFDVSLYGHITMDTIISKDSKDCTVGSIGNLWKMFSIINPSENEHIGEAQLFIDDALGDAQLSVLIGRKDLWHLGYGSSSVITLMDHAFKELDLYRVWVDIPEYNTHARNMFESLGFQHEGTLRQSRPHHGARYNSAIMGMLKNEFVQIYGEDLEKLFK